MTISGTQQALQNGQQYQPLTASGEIAASALSAKPNRTSIEAGPNDVSTHSRIEDAVTVRLSNRDLQTSAGLGRISQIAQAISDGTYDVPPIAIAEAILDQHRSPPDSNPVS